MLRTAFAALTRPRLLAAGYLVVIGMAIKELTAIAQAAVQQIDELDARILGREARLRELKEEIGCTMGAEAAPAPASYPGPVDVDPLHRAETALPDATEPFAAFQPPTSTMSAGFPPPTFNRSPEDLLELPTRTPADFVRPPTASEDFLAGNDLHP